MPTVANRTQPFDGTSVVSLTGLQQALWQIGLPILDGDAVAAHKKTARRIMLWRAVRWQLLAMAVLVGFECLGRDWLRASFVGAAALTLAGLFAWLVNVSDLRWATMDYPAYKNLHGVPAHVSATADALVRCGVAETSLGVEYLKNDPILFVEETGELSQIKRYDLVIW